MPIAKAMSTKFKQNITPFECERHWDSTGFRAKREFLAANPDSSDSSSEDENWSPDENKQLVYLKGQYDHKHEEDKWALIAQGLYDAGFTKRTEDDCYAHWRTKLEAKTKIFKPEEWSEEEDKRLTKLVKNFREWNTLNPWVVISEQMSMLGFRRATENCRTRWQETLRGPANYGNWAPEEEDLLLEYHSRCQIEELVDLLERRLHSIRSVDFCRDKLQRLKKASGNWSHWSEEQDVELIKAKREAPPTLKGEELWNHIARVVNQKTRSSRDPGAYESQWGRIGPKEDKRTYWSKAELEKLERLAKKTARDWQKVSEGMAEGTPSYNRSKGICRTQWNKKFAPR